MAAFVHDVGHRGLTNGYLCASLDRSALVHNDKSPNENSHTSTAFLTMFEGEHHFLHTAHKQTLQKFRARVIQLVTLTDMQRHNEVMTMFQEYRRSGMIDSSACLPFLLVCADLGHTVLPWKQHEQWVLRLQEEMFLQGDRELGGDLPVTPLCDRARGGLVKCQVPFFDVAVIPVYTELAAMCPGTARLLENARENRQTWCSKM